MKAEKRKCNARSDKKVDNSADSCYPVDEVGYMPYTGENPIVRIVDIAHTRWRGDAAVFRAGAVQLWKLPRRKAAFPTPNTLYAPSKMLRLHAAQLAALRGMSRQTIERGLRSVNKSKWYQKAGIVLLVIVLLPWIILMLFEALINYYLLQMPKDRRAYKKSRYYADFGEPFVMGILSDPAYRFYNAAMQRELPIEYVRQASNGFAYFIRGGILFLFPDFDRIDFDEEAAAWKADYDGDWKNFDENFAGLCAKLENPPTLPVRLLVEREMLSAPDLGDIPDCFFLVPSYETAFEGEDPMDTK